MSSIPVPIVTTPAADGPADRQAWLDAQALHCRTAHGVICKPTCGMFIDAGLLLSDRGAPSAGQPACQGAPANP